MFPAQREDPLKARSTVIALYPYFWPTFPQVTRVYRDVYESLARKGLDVLVVTTNYENKRRGLFDDSKHDHGEGIALRYVPQMSEVSEGWIVRITNYLVYLACAARAIVFAPSRPLVISGGHPPIFLAVLLRLLACLGCCDYILHFQDIQPEASRHLLRGWRWKIASITRLLDAWATRGAYRSVVLSQDMARTLSERGVPRSRITIINNAPPEVTPEAVSAAETAAPWVWPVDAGIRVIFAGSLGRFQGLEDVLEAARILQQRGSATHFLFVGAGPLQSWVEATIRERNLDNVTLLNYLPLDEALALIAGADLGLVTLAPGVIYSAFPSKTMTYLAVGVPIFAIVESDSELARQLTERGLGVVVPPGAPADISEALSPSDIGAMPSLRSSGAPIRDQAKELYSITLSVEKWLAMISDFFLDQRRRGP